MKTSKNIIATALTVMALTTACATGSRNAGGGEVTGVSGSFWAEPTPYGMVLVDRGSMEVGPQKADSAWNLKADARGISVDGFWMDETEITNSKYKQFVFWVRDSIIRERLADPAYGGNEEFKIEEDRLRHISTGTSPYPGAMPTRTSSAPSRASTAQIPSPVSASLTASSLTTAMRSTTTPRPPSDATASTRVAASTTPICRLRPTCR